MSNSTKTVRVTNKYGIHARPAAKLVELATTFDCDIVILKESQEVNAKSIMELMTLGATCGTDLTVKTEGTDGAQALEAMANLLASDFESDH